MKLELLFIAGVAFIILNIMHNNKYIKIIYTYKKYFRIGFIIVLAILFYLMIKRNPKNCKGLLLHANNALIIGLYSKLKYSSAKIISKNNSFGSGNL